MIFVTVGYQMPFDRLIAAVDSWAGENPDVEIFAQIGPGRFKPKHMPFLDFVEPSVFNEKIKACSAIVAHAGMGSILTAFEHGKPILVMPRYAAKSETRNDHQIATAARLGNRDGIEVAKDESEIPEKLARLSSLETPPKISSNASPELLERLARFVKTGH